MTTQPLEGIRIAAPCSMDWNSMKGDDTCRFCPACSKNVYFISGMERQQAMDLIATAEGTLCVRLFRRADDSVMTADCPVGLRQRLWLKLSRTAAMLVAFMGLSSFESCEDSQDAQSGGIQQDAPPDKTREIKGDICPPAEPKGDGNQKK